MQNILPETVASILGVATRNFVGAGYFAVEIYRPFPQIGLFLKA
jgi:hypothetical protein